MLEHLRSTCDLLRQRHREWGIQCVGAGDSTILRAKELVLGRADRAPLLVLAPMPRAGVLRLCAALPLERLAFRDSGLGRREHGYPARLCPIQLAVAIGFRLRNLGWPVEFHWPATLLLQGEAVGVINCELSRGRWLFTEAAFCLSRDPAASGSEDALVVPFRTSLAAHRPPGAEGPEPLDLLPTMLHGMINGLESPWPRKLTLGFYNRWFVNLGHAAEGAGRGDGTLKGIARAVADDGSLTLESEDGKSFPLPIEIHGDGAP